MSEFVNVVYTWMAICNQLACLPFGGLDADFSSIRYSFVYVHVVSL